MATGSNERTNTITTITDPDGRQVVVGGVLSGVADDTTAPIKVGGRFNATPPTLTDAQRGDLQLDSRGNLKMGLYNGATAVNAISMATADALTPSGLALMVQAFSAVFNGATWDRLRTANVFKTFASTAITAGTGVTLWTPTAGKKFRLMGWLVSSSAAGQLIFGDNLVATIIARSEAVAAAGTSNVPNLGNGILSAAANNLLKLDGPTGNVAGMVWGTEE